MIVTLLSVLLPACAGDHAPAAAASNTAAPVLEAPAGDPTVGATTSVGPTVDLTVGSHTISVEVADTQAQREHGLMYRDGLAPDHGMIFVYPDQRERGFWMKNTRIPLSIAFLDGQGRVVSVSEMQPLDLSTTRSQRPAMYAVELAADWFADHGVKVGAKIEGLPGPSRD